jgi:hypothetical protein
VQSGPIALVPEDHLLLFIRSTSNDVRLNLYENNTLSKTKSNPHPAFLHGVCWNTLKSAFGMEIAPI